MSSKKEYNLGIDVVKSCAAFFVIAYHFILNTVVEDLTYSSIAIFCYSLIRQFFIIAVPLFLLVSGYLMGKKKVESSYFKKISPILVTYSVIAIVSGIIRVIFIKDIINIQDFVVRFFDFNLNGYSWYVGMYIGLYLFIPFINILLDQLDQKNMKILILIFLFICGLACFVNNFPLINQWFRLPGYWVNFYPIMYYVLGVYLKRYPITDMKKAVGMTIIPFVIAIIAHNYYSEGYFSDHVGYYASIINVIQAVGFFSIVMLMDFSKVKETKRKILRKISSLTLEIYLCSFVADKLLYPKWIDLLGHGKELILFSPVIMVIHFVLSFLMAILMHFIIQQIMKLGKKRKGKTNESNQIKKQNYAES